MANMVGMELLAEIEAKGGDEAMRRLAGVDWADLWSEPRQETVEAIEKTLGRTLTPAEVAVVLTW